MNVLELSEQEQIRRGSMAELRRLGIEPYPAAEYTVTGRRLLLSTVSSWACTEISPVCVRNT